jgi:hypothetical protein
MTALDRLLIGCILAAALLVGGVLGIQHYGAEQFKAGQASAVAAGEKARQVQADANRKTESDLRATLAAKDADAFTKEQTYATNLDAAQRRVRTGTDRLRCPASPVPAGAAPGDRPVAGGPAPDGPGAELVPESAADILGDAAAVAGLVRKYDRVVERFEACRALNAVP